MPSLSRLIAPLNRHVLKSTSVTVNAPTSVPISEFRFGRCSWRERVAVYWTRKSSSVRSIPPCTP